MYVILAQNHDALGWTLQEWADRLGCVRSTVHGTSLWQNSLRWLTGLEREERLARWRLGAVPKLHDE